MILEELLAVGLEDFPGGIRNDRVEAASLVQNLIKLVAPMERVKSFDIGQPERALLGFAFVVFVFIPGGLLVLDAKVVELFEQDTVERVVGFAFSLVDRVARGGQV